MANRRILVKRRKAVLNTRKITRTMQLIATTQFQAAYNRVVASRPYAQKLAEMMSHLAGAGEGVDHPLMQSPKEHRRSDLLVLTSNRGLCGAYNAHVVRVAAEHIEAERAKGAETDLSIVGKKGVGFMRFRGLEMANAYTELGDRPTFEQVEPIASKMMARFIAGETQALNVAYMKFESKGRQKASVEQILPIAPQVEEGDGHSSDLEYEFSPAPRELLDELLPATVRVRIFQCFNDAIVSEQVSRMIAMTAATDAAEDLIKRLTQQYNRARQTAITMELLDIVGGANALA